MGKLKRFLLNLLWDDFVKELPLRVQTEYYQSQLDYYANLLEENNRKRRYADIINKFTGDNSN